LRNWATTFQFGIAGCAVPRNATFKKPVWLVFHVENLGKTDLK
jgi:hypothetical protein